MPNCYSLTRIGETEPTPLVKIDEEICALMGKPVHPKDWCCYWEPVIGLCLACGATFDKIIADTGFSDDIKKIATFLKANFTVNAWAER